MKKYIKILRWIWELPQCILGLMLTKIYNVEYKETYNGIKIYTGEFPGGISLGLYILMSEYNYTKNDITKKHEFGHTKQSAKWGPLYLMTVGITSAGWNILRRMFPKLKKNSYYSVWPENEADKLGGVERC